MKNSEESLLAAWFGFGCGIITMLIVIAVALSMSSCAASHSRRVLTPQPPDVLAALPPSLSPSALAALPPYLVPAPAGSTPRQARQWQRAQAQNLARAGVLPAKVKNSSVATAPGATAINRPASAVATGSGAATDARKAGKGPGAVAVGPGAVATATSSGPAWWWYLVAAVLGAAVWEYVSSQVAPLRAVLRWRP